MTLKERAKEIKLWLPTIYIALRNKETPLIAKVFAVITLGYALSPIDLIPDFIPVLGYLDDVILLPFLITLTIKCIPKKILIEARQEALQLSLQKKWYYALPIVLLWIAILVIIIKMIKM